MMVEPPEAMADDDSQKNLLGVIAAAVLRIETDVGALKSDVGRIDTKLDALALKVDPDRQEVRPARDPHRGARSPAVAPSYPEPWSSSGGWPSRSLGVAFGIHRPTIRAETAVTNSTASVTGTSVIGESRWVIAGAPSDTGSRIRSLSLIMSFIGRSARDAEGGSALRVAPGHQASSTACRLAKHDDRAGAPNIGTADAAPLLP
jgi:hypothetical protein